MKPHESLRKEVEVCGWGKEAKEIPGLCYNSFGLQGSSMVHLALGQVPLKSRRSLLSLWFPHALPAALCLPSGKSHSKSLCHDLPHPHRELVRPLSEVKAWLGDGLFTPVQEREVWWEAWEGKTFPSAPMETWFFSAKLNTIHFFFFF